MSICAYDAVLSTTIVELVGRDQYPWVAGPSRIITPALEQLLHGVCSVGRLVPNADSITWPTTTVVVSACAPRLLDHETSRDPVLQAEISCGLLGFSSNVSTSFRVCRWYLTSLNGC